MILKYKSAKDKYYLLSWVLIILFLTYSIFLALGSLEGTPGWRTDNGFYPYLIDKPLTEDGYYLLTVAWNIAEGKGFTYNSGIKTTGVQPLAAIVYSIPSFIVQNLNGTKYDFTRAVLIVSSLLQILFAYLIYKLALAFSNQPKKGLYFLISVCAALFNFKVLLNFNNGLETGLYLILLSVFFLYWLKYIEIHTPFKHLIAAGLLSGLLLLCRLDSAAILFIFSLTLLYFKKIKINQVVIVGLIALLIYLPWQMYILEITGNIFGSSARSQTGIFPFFDLPYKLVQYFSSLIQHITPFLYTGNILVWLMFPLGLIYLFFIYILYKNVRRRIIKSELREILTAISVSFVTLLLIYFLFSSAPHFYFRYTAFIMVLSFPLFVILFAELFIKTAKYQSTLVSLIIILFCIQSYIYLHSGKSARAFSVRLEFVERNNFKDKHIGSFQTGILGYFNDNVINLDGKMDNNSLESFSNGGIEKYIDKMNINVFMEWEDFVPFIINKEYLEKHWQIYSEDIGDGRTICYVRK